MRSTLRSILRGSTPSARQIFKNSTGSRRRSPRSSDAFSAEGFGVAQYFAYSVNDWLKIVGHGEIWRDVNGFFVAAFPHNLDFVNAELGRPATVIGGGKTTYGALTLGLNIRPTVPKPLGELIIRPEIRYDTALTNTKPFDNGTKSSQFTFGGDVILKF